MNAYEVSCPDCGAVTDSPCLNLRVKGPERALPKPHLGRELKAADKPHGGRYADADEAQS